VLQAAADDFADALRDREAPAVGSGGVEPSVGGEQAYHFREEERVAFCLFVDRLRETDCRRMAGGDLEIPVDVFAGETVEDDPRRDGMPRELGQRARERMVTSELDIAVRRDHDDASDGHLRRQVAEKQQRRLVGPVQIVEHEQQRLALGRVLEERGDRIEETEPGLLRLERGW
jgi:hypothetical protein